MLLAILFLRVWFAGVPIVCIADTGSIQTVLRASDAALLGAPVIAPASVPVLLAANATPLRGVLQRVPNVGVQDMFGLVYLDVLVVPDRELIVPCILGVDAMAATNRAWRFDWRVNVVGPEP